MNIKAKIQEAIYNYDWSKTIENAFKNIDLNSIIHEKVERYIESNFDIIDLVEVALENATYNTIKDNEIEIEETILEAIEAHITAPW